MDLDDFISRTILWSRVSAVGGFALSTGELRQNGRGICILKEDAQTSSAHRLQLKQRVVSDGNFSRGGIIDE
jgi:hypothetical protein